MTNNYNTIQTCGIADRPTIDTAPRVSDIKFLMVSIKRRTIHIENLDITVTKVIWSIQLTWIQASQSQLLACCYLHEKMQYAWSAAISLPVFFSTRLKRGNISNDVNKMHGWKQG